MAKKKKKSNGASMFAILALMLVSVTGIIAIVFISKDLLSGDGVNETTTIPFTANVEVKDVKWPMGVEVTPAEFVNNIDNVSGISCEFNGTVDTSKEGISDVELLVKSEDGSSKTFTAKLEIYSDTVAPVLTGVIDRHFNVGDSITYLKGISATDEMEGEVEVKVDNSAIKFDDQGNAIEGNYQVTYTATDRSGNTTTQAATFYFEVNGVSDEMIDEAVAKTLSQIIKEDMTLAQKAFAIYNFTYDNIAYTGDSEKGDYRLEGYRGLTNFSGDCYTYFSAAKLLLEAINVPTIDVTRTEGSSLGHHYWLLVDLGTGYYHFDSTRRSHYFNGFMATDAQIAEYSTNVVYGFYTIDNSLYPATPTENFAFEQYAGSTN